MVRPLDRFVAVPGNHPVKVPAGAGALRNPRVAAAPRSSGGGLRLPHHRCASPQSQIERNPSEC